MHYKIRCDKLLHKLGYCNRRTFKEFASANEVSWKPLPTPTTPMSYKLQQRLSEPIKGKTLVFPHEISVNGKDLEFIHEMNIVAYKPLHLRCTQAEQYYSQYVHPHLHRSVNIAKEVEEEEELTVEEQNELAEMQIRNEEEEGELFDILPELFVYRSPSFMISKVLPQDAEGLVLLTQKKEFYKQLDRVDLPLERIYEIKLENSFTGLEQEALNLFRMEPMKQEWRSKFPKPKFQVIDSKNKIAHVTIYDYRPDHMRAMLLSMKHKPVEVKRVAIGNIILSNSYTDTLYGDKKDAHFVNLDTEEKRWSEINDSVIVNMLANTKSVDSYFEKYNRFENSANSSTKSTTTTSNKSSKSFKKEPMIEDVDVSDLILEGKEKKRMLEELEREDDDEQDYIMDEEALRIEDAKSLREFRYHSRHPSRSSNRNSVKQTNKEMKELETLLQEWEEERNKAKSRKRVRGEDLNASNYLLLPKSEKSISLNPLLKKSSTKIGFSDMGADKAKIDQIFSKMQSGISKPVTNKK